MGEVEVSVHTSILALDRQEWFAFLPQPLHLKYHMSRNMGGPQEQPGSCGDQEISCPARI
jgi:hypothetical protein